MRVNCEGFRRNICLKCDKYTGDKPVFGKCVAGMTEIYRCARQMVEARFKPTPEASQ